jgi:hypothetical protein
MRKTQYLGFQQSRLIAHAESKRPNNLYQKAQLNPQEQATRENLVNAINTFAASTRPLLVTHCFHHPTSADERVIVSRKQGGRGLVDVSAPQKANIQHD